MKNKLKNVLMGIMLLLSMSCFGTGLYKFVVTPGDIDILGFDTYDGGKEQISTFYTDDSTLY